MPGVVGAVDPEPAANVACQPSFAAFAPDRWAAPKGVRAVAIFPTMQSVAHGDRSVGCLYDARSAPATASLHTDPSGFTAEQRAYLAAVEPFDAADAGSLDPGSGLVSGDDLVGWSRRMADGEQRTVAALEQASVPEAARPELAALLDRHRAALTAWQSAAAATGADAVKGTLAAALAADLAGQPHAAAVRRALGLATAVPAGSGAI
ncbi:hypothetical protein GCM10010441_25330 [Kitasatospora paracochleata]